MGIQAYHVNSCFEQCVDDTLHQTVMIGAFTVFIWGIDRILFCVMINCRSHSSSIILISIIHII